MFTAKRTIRYSECGRDGRLTIPAIVNHFQDTSTEHSESLGVGVNFMKSIQRAWILASWQICICKRPAIGEPVQVQTWPTGFKGIYGDRNYVMRDEKGEVLAYANSIWLYLNTETGRPDRVDPEMAARYENEPPYEMEYAPRKIVGSEMEPAGEAFPIRRYHLDTNNHVNNSRYIEMALEYLPENFIVSQLRVEYKKAALLGDTVFPKVAKEETRILIELCDETGQIYATTEWIGEYKA